eukprot:6465356-Amphidinium_carterae.1
MVKLMAAAALHDFTSLQVNVMHAGASVLLHCDKFNEQANDNTLLFFGKFTGGRLWLQGAGCLPPPIELDPKREHKELRGGFVPCKPGELITFDAHKWHGVEE